MCKTYPALFVVPKDASDECVRKSCKYHRQNRLPIVVWRHPANNSILFRSSAFHGKGFIGMLMKSQGTTSINVNGDQHQQQSAQNASMEQDKYINEIFKLTKSFNYALNIKNNLFESNANVINNPAFAGANNINCMSNEHEQQANQPNANGRMNKSSKHKATNSFSMTPVTNRRSLLANKIEKAVKTIKNNYMTNTNGSTASSAHNGSNGSTSNQQADMFHHQYSFSSSSNSNYLPSRNFCFQFFSLTHHSFSFHFFF
jgi:hypothetical protein